jgi:glycosyltransferase involved in cell wall biosynthesis
VKVKRVDLFLEAAALLLNEFPSRNWMFHVFGDGPLRASLETRAAFLRIGDKVVFHGHKQDVLTDMSGLHSLVICSDHEGLPMTALEAIALGVPIVAHAVGGLSEQLPDVLRITRHDGIGYAHGIMCALREFSNDISKINDANYLERFSAHNNAIRIRAIYEEIASTRTAYRRLS